MLTGAHRYSAPSLSPSGDELISLKGLKMKISDNGKISSKKSLDTCENDSSYQLSVNWCASFCSSLFVFCKPINCPSIVVVVAFLCKCLTALLDGATSDGREPSVSRYSQQKTFQMLQNHSMLNIHLSVRISAWIPLFVLKPWTLFDVFFTPVCILRCAATQVVTGHVMSWEGTLPHTGTATRHRMTEI